MVKTFVIFAYQKENEKRNSSYFNALCADPKRTSSAHLQIFIEKVKKKKLVIAGKENIYMLNNRIYCVHWATLNFVYREHKILLSCFKEQPPRPTLSSDLPHHLVKRLKCTQLHTNK